MKKITVFTTFLFLLLCINQASAIVNVDLNGSRWTGDSQLALGLRNDSSVNMSGLAGYWSFDETVGTLARNVNNESGLINTTNRGTLYNFNPGLNNCTGNCSGWNSSGRIGNALAFDGVNDYVNMGNDVSLQLINETTFSAWINKQSVSMGFEAILTKSNGVDYGNGAQLTRNLNGFRWKTGVTHVDSGSYENGWHYIVGTFSGTTAKLYVDGIYISSAQTTLSNLGVNVLVGGYSAPSDTIYRLYSKDNIDEVRIYNRALSASEVAFAYNTSMRTMSMPVIMNQSTHAGFVIDRTKIIYTGQDSINNISIYGRNNGTTVWLLLHSNITSNIWYPIYSQFNNMDFGIELKGNGSNTPFFISLEWDVTPIKTNDNDIFISEQNYIYRINNASILYKIVLNNLVTTPIIINDNNIIYAAGSVLYTSDKRTGTILYKNIFKKNINIYNLNNLNVTKVIT